MLNICSGGPQVLQLKIAANKAENVWYDKNYLEKVSIDYEGYTD